MFFIFLTPTGGAHHALENGGRSHTGQVTPELRKLRIKERKHCCYTATVSGEISGQQGNR